jgi:hypothetical protein
MQPLESVGEQRLARCGGRSRMQRVCMGLCRDLWRGKQDLFGRSFECSVLSPSRHFYY